MTHREHQLVQEFAHTFGHPIHTTPTPPTAKLRKLRTKLLREEYTELVEAANAGDIIEVADGIGDIAYIAHGTLHAYGLPYRQHPGQEPIGLAHAYMRYQDAERAAAQTVGPAATALFDAIHRELNQVLVDARHTAWSHKIPFDQVFAEIHASNMSKLGDDGKPIVRADGKTLKGPRYRPPNLAPILIAAGHTVSVTVGKAAA